MKIIKNQRKFSRIVFAKIFFWATCTLIIGTQSSANVDSTGKSLITADSFEILERKIQLSPPEKLSLVEHDVARFMQERPASAEGQFAMSTLLLRIFLHEPSNTELIRQSADLAAQAYELNPKSELGIVALASVLDVSGETAKGLALLQEAKNKNLKLSWRYHLATAKLLSAEQPGPEVLEELKQALADPTANRSLVAPYVTAILSASDEGTLLLSSLANWDSRFPCEDFKLALAQVQVRHGLLTEALTNYRHILAQSPNNAEAQLGEGFVLLKSGHNFSAAAKALKRAVELDLPEFLKSEARLSLSVALIRSGDFKEGTAQGIQAIAASQNAEPSLIILIDELNHQKRYSDVISLLDGIDDNVPGVALSHAIRGEVLTSKYKKNVEGIRAYSDAIALDSAKATYYNGRGLASYGLNHMDQALVDFQSAIRIDPSDASARYNMACALALMGRKDEAVEALASALDLDDRLTKQAQVDNDFNSLRSMSEFQMVVNQLHSNPSPVVAH